MRHTNALVISLFLVLVAEAQAHGPAEWIQNGGYKNSAGELCCGERDCVELEDDQVKVTPGGYRVVLPQSQRAPGYIVGIHDELVPFNETTPSPDGKYWRCAWNGMRKCFFAPPSST